MRRLWHFPCFKIIVRKGPQTFLRPHVRIFGFSKRRFDTSCMSDSSAISHGLFRWGDAGTPRRNILIDFQSMRPKNMKESKGGVGILHKSMEGIVFGVEGGLAVISDANLENSKCHELCTYILITRRFTTFRESKSLDSCFLE